MSLRILTRPILTTKAPRHLQAIHTTSRLLNMSNLKYFSYPGFGESAAANTGYSQAVRIPAGEQIQISGQGGWDPTTKKVHEDIEAEYKQAFDNVELSLKHAGGKGWEQVYAVRSYHVNMNDEDTGIFVKLLKERAPHKPLVTAVGVAKLAGDTMRIEIEVMAHLG